MPIYEYHCPSCGTEFETLVSGQHRVECPMCQSATVRRTLSMFGVTSGGTAMSPGSASACGCTSCSCRSPH